MVSKRTTPETRRAYARIAGAGSVAGALWLALVVTGCPLRDKEIRITDDGVRWVRTACEPSRGGPFPPSGSGGSGPGGPGGGSGPGGGFPPPPGGGYDPNACVVADRYYSPTFWGGAAEARLFLVSPAERRVQDASKCMSLRPCLDGGQFGPVADCMASDLNQQLDGAMPNGLGFEGLKNPEEAQLILAIYQPSPSEGAGGCHRTDLVACAGLAAPLGGGAYDITCASCQGGSRTAPGSNNGPCPRELVAERTSCFLQVCDDLLASSGFE
jgi:hypothetical protein